MNKSILVLLTVSYTVKSTRINLYKYFYVMVTLTTTSGQMITKTAPRVTVCACGARNNNQKGISEKKNVSLNIRKLIWNSLFDILTNARDIKVTGDDRSLKRFISI